MKAHITVLCRCSRCPYIFFGPNRGKYRHPHIAYAAVEVWLANKSMPDKCGSTWLDNNPGL